MKANWALFWGLAAAISGVLPAADFPLSVGGGAYIGGHFTRYTLRGDGEIQGSAVTVAATQDMDQLNYGGFLVFDAQWVELGVGLQGGVNTFTETNISDFSDGTTRNAADTGNGTEAMLAVSLLGKYPIALNERFTLFPLAGLEYQIALLERRAKNGRPAYDRADGRHEFDSDSNALTLPLFNALLVDIGAGLDTQVAPSVYLRTELLYGFRLQTFYEQDALQKLKKALQVTDPKLAGLSSGPTLKISALWRFY
jgi:opacity protein-like surface antigen